MRALRFIWSLLFPGMGTCSCPSARVPTLGHRLGSSFPGHGCSRPHRALGDAGCHPARTQGGSLHPPKSPSRPCRTRGSPEQEHPILGWPQPSPPQLSTQLVPKLCKEATPKELPSPFYLYFLLPFLSACFAHSRSPWYPMASRTWETLSSCPAGIKPTTACVSARARDTSGCS